MNKLIGLIVALLLIVVPLQAQLNCSGGISPLLSCNKQGKNVLTSYGAAPYPLGCNRGLVMYYPLLEGSGSTTADQSGNGNTATLNGSAAFIASGKFRGGASFTGANGDYIGLSNVAVVQALTNITVSAWFKTTVTSRQIIFSKSAGGTNSEWFIQVGASADTIGWSITTATGPTRQDYNPTLSHNSWADGNWHNLVGTWDGSSQIVYFDGAVVGTPQAISGTMNSTTTPINISNFNGAGTLPLNGSAAEAKVWNRTLSAAEVLVEFQSVCPIAAP